MLYHRCTLMLTDIHTRVLLKVAVPVSRLRRDSGIDVRKSVMTLSDHLAEQPYYWVCESSLSQALNPNSKPYTLTLELQIVQFRYYYYTLGPNVGISYRQGAPGRVNPEP